MFKKIYLPQKTGASSLKSVMTNCVRNQTILSQSTAWQTNLGRNMCMVVLVIHITVIFYYCIQNSVQKLG